MDDLISAEPIEPGLWRLCDPMGYLAHLVVGEKDAALVDAMLGIGDVRAVAERLAGGRRLHVLLTHRHPDHVGGAYRFDEVMKNEAPQAVIVAVAVEHLTGKEAIELTQQR